MSLYDTEYELNGVAFRITCEDMASGLDGIDGKAWLFVVEDRAADTRAYVQAGVESELLAAWQEASGNAIANEELIQLLADELKAGLKEGRIDAHESEETARVVLRHGNASESLSAERERLKGLL